MPLLKIEQQKLTLLRPTNFRIEKDLQVLIEQNLAVVFNCRLVATQFSTGSEHAGRIDSLALSEENNPVIIEYKKVESSELVNQGLYYLSWINDHRGDFEVVTKKALGSEIEIDWSEIRVICIAPGFKKFDLHAVKMMRANIELWQYRLFDEGYLYFEEVFRKSGVYLGAPTSINSISCDGDILTPQAIYTFEHHLEKADANIRTIVQSLRDLILNLDEAIDEVPKKFYIAYKNTQNFVCMEIQKRNVILYLKLNPDEVSPMPKNARDVSKIGHFGTGDLELVINTSEDAQNALGLIEMALQKVGG